MSDKSLKLSEKAKEKLASFGVYLVSALGAIGSGLQNYMAISSLLSTVGGGALALIKGGAGIIHSIAIALGGLCGGVVNFMFNVDLLKSFMQRITGKKNTKRKNLSNWEKLKYWLGVGVFITTGLLFGATAFAFTPVGALAILGVIAGVLVSVIMIIQELETWLQSFDVQEIEMTPIDGAKDGVETKPEPKKSFKEKFIEWKNGITIGKVIGFTIAVGNVIGLSLLFMMGLTTFLTGVGAPAGAALIASCVVAFTAGAFTEFYFYHSFLSDICNNFKAKWEEFKTADWPVLGGIVSAINGIVMGVLTYVGIGMIAGLLVTAGVAVPPVGAMIAIGVIAAIFTGLASFILGANFWKNNIAEIKASFVKIKNYFTKQHDDLSTGESDELSKSLLTDNVVSEALQEKGGEVERNQAEARVVAVVVKNDESVNSVGLPVYSLFAVSDQTVMTVSEQNKTDFKSAAGF